MVVIPIPSPCVMIVAVMIPIPTPFMVVAVVAIMIPIERQGPNREG